MIIASFFIAPLGAAPVLGRVFGHSGGITVCCERPVCVAMASGIEATAGACARPQTGMAWSLDGAPQSSGQCTAPDFDLRRGNAGFFLLDLGAGALSERRVWNHGENDWLRIPLRRNFFRLDAICADRPHRRPDW